MKVTITITGKPKLIRKAMLAWLSAIKEADYKVKVETDAKTYKKLYGN